MGVAILATLFVLGLLAVFFADGLDAREHVLLDAWNATWIAPVVWLLTDLRRWFSKVLFGLGVLSSVGSLTQGLGLWYPECFQHSEQSGQSTSSFSYCIPHLGSSREFR